MTMVWCLAGLLGLAASVEDLRTRTIPNWLTAAGTAAGMICAASGGWRSLALAVAGGAVGFLVMMPLNLCGAMGGGDVKLTAAFGTLLGPAGILGAAVFGAIAGALCAFVAMLRGARAIPYAPAIAAGVWISLIGGGL
jgi:Flp pilus assembly protein protease CpaA